MEDELSSPAIKPCENKSKKMLPKPGVLDFVHKLNLITTWAEGAAFPPFLDFFFCIEFL